MRLLVGLVAASILASSAALATMKPEYKENARCRGALAVTPDAMMPESRPGETDEQTIARYSQSQPQMGLFIGNLLKSNNWFEQTMIQDEAMATTAAESQQLQLIEDAEAKRLNDSAAAAKSDSEADAVLNSMFDAVAPCMKKAGLTYR